MYVNIRDKVDAFTAHYVLTKGQGVRYLPYRLPVFSTEDLLQLPHKSISQRVADILNLFYSSNLNGSDIAASIGNAPICIAVMHYKLAILETWRNRNGSFDSLAKSLYHLVALGNVRGNEPSEWFRISVKIAVLYSAIGELMKTGVVGINKPIDIALSADDFESVMAAWLGRKMGMPIRDIILSCEENGSLWEFLRYGQLKGIRADMDTGNPELEGLEMLIHAVFGFSEADRFRTACCNGKPYNLRDEQLMILSKNMLCTAVGEMRIRETIPNFFRTNSYLLDYDAAAAYAGLQDYRAASGETGAVMILSHRKPQSMN